MTTEDELNAIEAETYLALIAELRRLREPVPCGHPRSSLRWTEWPEVPPGRRQRCGAWSATWGRWRRRSGG